MGYDVSKETVGEFLKRGLYHIPPIQRRYSWYVENWERLWKDIESFHKDDYQSFYLLHTVITVQENFNSRIEILDGQQRTTTMLAMISAAIDIVELNGQTRANGFYAEGLNEVLRDSHSNKRLTTFYDKDAPMLEWVQEQPHLRGNGRKRSRVWKAYNFFFQRCFKPVIEEKGEEEGCAHIMSVVYKSMLTKCYVTVAKFGSMPEAVTAFDTTNNTGKALSTADLLRYWMLRNGQHNAVGLKEHVEEGWNRINEALEDNDKDIKDYVVRYWCARLGERYTAAKLLKHLNEEMKSTYAQNRDALQNLMNEMAEGALLYHDLIDPATTAHNRRALRLMRKAGATQHLTTLLAGKLSGYDDAQMGRLINLTERVFFWYQVVAERGGSALYQKYAHWAGIVFAARTPDEGLVQLEGEVATFLQSHNLDQDRLAEAFRALATDKVAKVTFVLGHLEIHVNPDTALASEDDMRVHRIAPESDETGAWPDWHGEDVDSEVHANSIGNWMLLPATVEPLHDGYTVNDVAQRAGCAPEVTTSSSLASASAWTVEDVVRRQQEMFEICLEIWPI